MISSWQRTLSQGFASNPISSELSGQPPCSWAHAITLEAGRCYNVCIHHTKFEHIDPLFSATYHRFRNPGSGGGSAAVGERSIPINKDWTVPMHWKGEKSQAENRQSQVTEEWHFRARSGDLVAGWINFSRKRMKGWTFCLIKTQPYPIEKCLTQSCLRTDNWTYGKWNW